MSHREPAPNRHPSMFDVAALAGVSAQTVSRVSNGAASVRESTRLKVVAAMRELGYRPNAAARALKRGSFQSIGVIATTLAGYGNLHTIEGIVSAASTRGWSVTLMLTSDRAIGSVSGAYARLSEASVDALVLAVDARVLDENPMEFPPGLPVVVVDAGTSSRHTVVDNDQSDGARQATEHLLALGHTRIAHLGGPRDSYAAAARREAFAEALRSHGLTAAAVIESDWRVESGHRAAAEIVASDATAVFAANDDLALGLARALHERGMRLPHDMSIVGYDNSPAAESSWPQLTSVDQDFAAVGRACVDHLLAALDGDDELATRLIVPTRLVVRSSTAAPRPT